MRDEYSMDEGFISHLVGLAKLVGAGLITAIITVAVFTVLSGQSRELANRVDTNAATTRAGVAAVVCILNIQPEDRTEAGINECLVANDFATIPTFP